MPDRALIGVEARERTDIGDLPVEVEIDSGTIGGPVGRAWPSPSGSSTSLTPGELTDGRAGGGHRHDLLQRIGRVPLARWIRRPSRRRGPASTCSWSPRSQPARRPRPRQRRHVRVVGVDDPPRGVGRTSWELRLGAMAERLPTETPFERMDPVAGVWHRVSPSSARDSTRSRSRPIWYRWAIRSKPASSRSETFESRWPRSDEAARSPNLSSARRESSCWTAMWRLLDDRPRPRRARWRRVPAG